MKKVFLTLLLLLFAASLAYAGYVKGYTRKDGTYVRGHNRSNSNYTVRDNYSYKGNYNPYTGKTGTNYYRNNPTSQHYGTKGNANSSNTSNSIFRPQWGR